MIIELPAAPAQFVGAGSGEAVLERAIATRAAVVCDAAVSDRIAGLGVVDPVVVADPVTLDRIDALAARFRACGTRAVVAVGGGNVLDLVKLAVAETTNPGITRWLRARALRVGFVDRLRVGAAPLPFVAVPTTLGTGSESNSAACFESSSEGGAFKTLVHLPGVLAESVAHDPTWTAAPESLLLAGELEIAARLVCGAVCSPSDLAIAETEVAFLVAALASAGPLTDPDARLVLAHVSARSHSGPALRGRGVAPSLIWPIATELSMATGTTKNRATAALLRPWLERVRSGDERWGSPTSVASLSVVLPSGDLVGWLSGLVAHLRRVEASPSALRGHTDAAAIARRVHARFPIGALRRLDVSDVTALVSDALVADALTSR